MRIACRRPQEASGRFYHQNPSEIRLEGFYDVARTTRLSSVLYYVMWTEANEITYNIAEWRDRKYRWLRAFAGPARCRPAKNGGSAWESNPPGTVLTPHTGFEVQFRVNSE